MRSLLSATVTAALDFDASEATTERFLAPEEGVLPLSETTEGEQYSGAGGAGEAAARTLVPFAKAYSGLTDAEMGRVDAVVRKTTIESFGPVRSVKPTLVFELGFEGIARSTRHKSGIAVRFPRMLRWREDKPVDEADTLQTLAALLPDAGT